LIGVKDKPPWLTKPWKRMRDGDIILYLGIPCGITIFLLDIWGDVYKNYKSNLKMVDYRPSIQLQS
jgi:hypothetical protein